MQREYLFTSLIQIISVKIYLSILVRQNLSCWFVTKFFLGLFKRNFNKAFNVPRHKMQDNNLVWKHFKFSFWDFWLVWVCDFILWRVLRQTQSSSRVGWTARNSITWQSFAWHFWQQINCSNPVNPGSTGIEQLTKKVTNGRHWRAVDTSF